MSVEQELPSDPRVAVEILAALVLKDKDETLCRYPLCTLQRQAPTGIGRPSVYCDNPEHDAVTNHRARKYLKALAEGMQQAPPTKQELSAGVVPVQSLRSSVVQEIVQLQGNLERYVFTLTELADPDISAAQIQVTLDQAAARVAEAQQNASAERSLRLTADAARTSALQEAQAERDAAELAIQHLEEADARTQSFREETERLIREIQTERDATVDQVRTEAQRMIEKIEQDAGEAIAHAETVAAEAQEKVRLADLRVHDAEAEARSHIATANRLVREAQATLEREREEVDRLRGELGSTLEDARRRADADQATLERERNEARATLERERGEVDRLRTENAFLVESTREQVTTYRNEVTQLRMELAENRIRADKLASVNDELRTQFAQKQIEERDTPQQL